MVLRGLVISVIDWHVIVFGSTDTSSVPVAIKMLRIFHTKQTSNLFNWFMIFICFKMNFLVYFAAYSVYSPPVGRAAASKNVLLAADYESTKPQNDRLKAW